MRPTADRAAAIAAVLLVVLIAHNAVLAVRNQLIFDRWHRLQVEDRALVDIAAASRNKNTANGFAMLYLMRERIGGAAVEVPPPFTRLGWWLRRVARIRAQTSKPRTIAAGRFAELAATAETRQLRIRPDDYTVHLRFGDRGERHAFVRRAGGDDWLLAPARLVGP